MFPDRPGGGAQQGRFPSVVLMVALLRDNGSVDVVVGEIGKKGDVPVPPDETLRFPGEVDRSVLASGGPAFAG